MAQFIGIIRGSRGEASRLGTKASGLRVTCAGWNKGVEVVAGHIDGRDIFEVYETGGSNGGKGRLIMVVK